MKKVVIWAVALLFMSLNHVQAAGLVKGMNLTELGNFVYDAAPVGGAKTPAQVAVDQIEKLGVKHIVLNPRAQMTNPKGNDIYPVVPVAERTKERDSYKRLIDYIHSKGMTVGIRPIFFVVHPDGTFPYRETQPSGKTKIWWHGNIQPSDPNRWFDSFKAYLDIYLLIAKLNKVEEFTLGAELYSMTVGIEDQWKEFPYGFPGKWLQLLRYTRAKLGANVRIMYDVNFTDDTTTSNGSLQASGGEFERWRYRLVDLANPTDPKQNEIWKNLVDFWKELDAVGIDMYRSLGDQNNTYSNDFTALSATLKLRADEYASQVDTTLAEIESVVGKRQTLIFKEVGFRSVDKGFINPFEYETGAGSYNEVHQAAAYQALYEAFWGPKFPWFGGASFWDVSVHPSRNTGSGDTGFSPVGKNLTTKVIQTIFKN